MSHRRKTSNFSYNLDKVTKLIFCDNIPEEKLHADVIFACSQCKCEIDIFNEDHALSWMMHQQESYHKNLSAHNNPQETTLINDDHLLKEEQRLFKQNERFWNNIAKNPTVKKKNLKKQKSPKEKVEKKTLKNQKYPKEKTRCVFKKENKAEIVHIENAEKLFQSQSMDSIPALILKEISKKKQVKKRDLLEKIYIETKQNGNIRTLEDVIPDNFDDIISGNNSVRSKSMESIPTLILKEILIDKKGHKHHALKKRKTPRILTVWHATSQNLKDKITSMKQRKQLGLKRKTGAYNAINSKLQLFPSQSLDSLPASILKEILNRRRLVKKDLLNVVEDGDTKVDIGKIMDAGNVVRAKSMESIPSSILKNILANAERNINAENVVLSLRNDNISSFIAKHIPIIQKTENPKAISITNDQLKSDMDQNSASELVVAEYKQEQCREKRAKLNNISLNEAENTNSISITNDQTKSDLNPSLDAETVVLEAQQEECRQKMAKLIDVVFETEDAKDMLHDQIKSYLDQSFVEEIVNLNDQQEECSEKRAKLKTGVENTNDIPITNDQINSYLDQSLDAETVVLEDQQAERREKNTKLNDVQIKSDLDQSLDTKTEVLENQLEENREKIAKKKINDVLLKENVCNTKSVNDYEDILTKSRKNDESQNLENELIPAHASESQVESQITKVLLNTSEVKNPKPHKKKKTSNRKPVKNDTVVPNEIQLDENGVDSSIEFTAASFKRLLKQGVLLNTELISNSNDEDNYEWKKRNRKRIHPKINYNLNKPKHFHSLNLTLLKLRAEDEMNLIYNMFTNVNEINNWGFELEDLARKQILKTFKLNTLISSINDTLKLMGCSNCSVHIFGSRATGLAIGDSNDLDVFIDFGVCKKFLDTSLTHNQILFLTCLRRGLRKYFGSHWVKLELITDTRVPIMKSRHRTRNIDCDISVKNSLSLCNSLLVKRLIFYIPVLRQIILLLRLWLEKCDLKSYINSYALTLLVIGSLQKQNLLPSIKYINENSEYVRIEGGWKTYDYEKCLLLSSPRKNEDKISLVECLYKFFQCYHNFDFDTYVVCPYLGKSIPKVDFKNFGKAVEADMPDYYESVGHYQDAEELRYATPMCIQDPVDMSHNLTKVMPQNAVRNFKMYCEISYMALRDIVCEN